MRAMIRRLICRVLGHRWFVNPWKKDFGGCVTEERWCKRCDAVQWREV